MTITFGYLDPITDEFFLITAEAFDAACEDFEVEVVDMAGITIPATVDFEEEARKRLIEAMPELEYNPYD